MAKDKGHNRLVYSTDLGRFCPSCGKAEQGCTCRTGQERSDGDGIVRISRQTKGRKGSGVSLVNGLSLGDKDLKKLAGTLKKKCGCGGTVKNGIIEIQGDKREVIAEELARLGYKVKLAGG